AAVGPKDQVCLVTFDGSNALRVAMTTEHGKILELIRRTKLGFGTRFYDAIINSLRYLSTSASERRILVVFSDGADHYSAHSFEQVVNTALFHDSPIYLFGYVGEDSQTWSERGRLEIQSRFQTLAARTGGKAFFLESADCSRIGRNIMEGARYQYRIGFYASSRLASDSTIKLRLRDESRGLSIRRWRTAAA